MRVATISTTILGMKHNYVAIREVKAEPQRDPTEAPRTIQSMISRGLGGVASTHQS